jgi:hypothetical protein
LLREVDLSTSRAFFLLLIKIPESVLKAYAGHRRVLDPTMTEAERDHFRSDFISAGLEVARLRAALSTRVDPFDDFHPQEGASTAAIAKIEATIPVLTQKVDIRKYLYDKDLGSKLCSAHRASGGRGAAAGGNTPSAELLPLAKRCSLCCRSTVT